MCLPSRVVSSSESGMTQVHRSGRRTGIPSFSLQFVETPVGTRVGWYPVRAGSARSSFCSTIMSTRPATMEFARVSQLSSFRSSLPPAIGHFTSRRPIQPQPAFEGRTGVPLHARRTDAGSFARARWPDCSATPPAMPSRGISGDVPRRHSLLPIDRPHPNLDSGPGPSPSPHPHLP